MQQTFRPKQLTTDDIRNGCVSLYGPDNTQTEVCVASEELRQGLDFVEKYEKALTIFGSARTPETDHYYKLAETIAQRSVTELDYAIVTGGGPGIMEAGNRGASNAGGHSLGMTIQLPHEQFTNEYVNEMIPFYFFYTRKTAMRYGSSVYLFFPGGYGTLDELMETLTLIQTGKISRVPIVLVGISFWQKLHDFICQDLVTGSMISEMDSSLYTITDDENEIMEIIRNAPIRDKE